MKNVVVIGPAHPLRGGIAAYTQRLAQQFQKDGFNVKVYTFSLQYPRLLFPGKTQLSSAQPPAGLSIYIKINSINPLTWIRTADDIASQLPDIVVFNYWMPFIAPCYGFIARRLKKACRASIIAVIHNMIPHERPPGDKLLSRYFVRACDGFLSMTSQVDKDVALFTNSSNRVVVPHPVYDHYGEEAEKSLACRHLKISASDRYVLFFGLVRKYKGLDLLIEAMADKRLAGLNVKLLVAGEFYGDKGFYDEIIARNNIYDRVIIRDEFVADEEVKYFFGAADIVVLPYRSATQSGVSSLAIHFEKPLIVSNFGGLPEVVRHGETGYVVEANATSIADALAEFFVSAPKEAMKEKIKEESKRYSWSQVTKAIIQLTLRKR